MLSNPSPNCLIAETEFIMSEPSSRVDTVHQPVDLLPWADPYIMQLFAESRLLGDTADGP